MKNVAEILETEEKYKKLLVAKLAGDDRITLSCPEFKYPEPAFVYIKSVKTDKSIAVRLDGVDKTMRFWDYVDDDYSDEDGVWAKMNEKGLDVFASKLYTVMEKAFDIEFYNLDGDCDDHYSGVAGFEVNEENARRAVKKCGKDVDFARAVFSDFYGEVEFVFDKKLNRIKR